MRCAAALCPKLLSVFALVVLCLSFAPTASADIAPDPGLRGISYSVSLENQQQFPNCVVLVPSCFPFYPQADPVAVILEGELSCKGGRIFAFARADFEAARPTWQTNEDPLAKLEKAPGLMIANQGLWPLRVVSESLDIDRAHDLLRIDQCGDGTLKVRFTKTVYTLKNGTRVEQNWDSSGSRPDPAAVVPRVRARGCGSCSVVGSSERLSAVLSSAWIVWLLLGRRAARRSPPRFCPTCRN